MHGSRENNGYIELKFGPQWKYISAVRSFIRSFLAVSINDEAKADIIAMAASELLENAVKYASTEETCIVVRVFPGRSDRIRVRVENRATPEAAGLLKELFDEISSGEPLEKYMEHMRRAATRNDGRSRLGLARIRYETGADMNLELADNGTVALTIEI